jgi:hypothetical protein
MVERPKAGNEVEPEPAAAMTEQDEPEDEGKTAESEAVAPKAVEAPKQKPEAVIFYYGLVNPY